MRSKTKIIYLIFGVIIFTMLFPICVLAEWNGIVPNSTTKDEVISILGEPSLDSGFILIYDGDRAPTDTKGAAIYYVRNTVVMVRVIPKKEMTEGEISGKFGNPKMVSFRNPEIEEQVYDSPTGKVVIIFTKKNRVPIRIDYL